MLPTGPSAVADRSGQRLRLPWRDHPRIPCLANLPPQTFHAWLLVLAVFVGVFAAKVADLAAVVVTTAAAMLAFAVLSTTTGAGVVPVSDVVAYCIPIGFAAVLGRGQRWMRGTDRASSDDHNELSG